MNQQTVRHEFFDDEGTVARVEVGPRGLRLSVRRAGSLSAARSHLEYFLFEAPRPGGGLPAFLHGAVPIGSDGEGVSLLPEECRALLGRSFYLKLIKARGG